MTAPILYRGNLVVPNDPRIAVLIPHAKHMTHNGVHYSVVPNKPDENRLLRNLGIDALPPILTEYTFPGRKPFESQKNTAAMITANPRTFVLSEVGVGKTAAALYAFDYLRQQGAATRMLIVAPLSALRLTWAKEVLTVVPHLRCNILTGSKHKRLKELEQLADIYVINHDGVAVILEHLLQRRDIDMIVYDELTAVKSATTERWKVTNRLVNAGHVKYAVGMTGTPTPKAPTDCYGQVRLINPPRMPMSFTRFREQVQFKLGAFKWCDKRDSTDTVFKAMSPAVRYLRDECYDLPPCQIVRREAALSAPQQTMYKKMVDDLLVSVAQGNVLAVNEADKLNKLVQISTGSVYTTERGIVEIPCGPRLEVLDEALEASPSKVIVFVSYKHSLRMVAEHVAKTCSVEVVSGDVTPAKREAIFHNFMNSPTPHVLVCHPACMSHSLTLTAASVIVWYGPPISLEVFQQANGRITRSGQQHSQLIVCITSTRLEERIYDRLEKRSELQGLLLEMYEDQELGSIL